MSRATASIADFVRGLYEPALNLPEVKERLLAAGTEVVASSPGQLMQVMKSEMSRWERIIRQAGIRE